MVFQPAQWFVVQGSHRHHWCSCPSGSPPLSVGTSFEPPAMEWLMFLLMRIQKFWLFGSFLWYSFVLSFVRWDKNKNDRGVDTVHVTESASHLPSGCILSLNCPVATSITPWQGNIGSFDDGKWRQPVRNSPLRLRLIFDIKSPC